MVTVKTRNAFLRWIITAALLALSACAAPRSYEGISFAPDAAPAEIQALARAAAAGNKRAQLDLGIRYEEANGVPRDLKRAERLYRRAASDTGGTTYVYTPPVGKHGKGRVVPVTMTGPKLVGLSEAKVRLGALREASKHDE